MFEDALRQFDLTQPNRLVGVAIVSPRLRVLCRRRIGMIALHWIWVVDRDSCFLQSAVDARTVSSTFQTLVLATNLHSDTTPFDEHASYVLHIVHLLPEADIGSSNGGVFVTQKSTIRQSSMQVCIETSDCHSDILSRSQVSNDGLLRFLERHVYLIV